MSFSSFVVRIEVCWEKLTHLGNTAVQMPGGSEAHTLLTMYHMLDQMGSLK